MIIRIIGALLALSIAASAHAAKKSITPESIKEDLIAARCKAVAKKYYAVINWKKRRAFERDCIERSPR